MSEEKRVDCASPYLEELGKDTRDEMEVRRLALQEAMSIALRCANTTEDYVKDKGCRWVAREIEKAIEDGAVELPDSGELFVEYWVQRLCDNHGGWEDQYRVFEDESFEPQQMHVRELNRLLHNERWRLVAKKGTIEVVEPADG